MRKFNVILIAIIVTLSLSGCKESKTEYSDTLHEEAIVANVLYTPSGYTPGIEPSFGGVGSTGFGPSGVGFRVVGSGTQISSIPTPEKFTVTFRCEHGEFEVHDKETYEEFKESVGAKADVVYRDVYHAVYETSGKEPVLISRNHYGHEVLDVSLIK